MTEPSKTEKNSAAESAPLADKDLDGVVGGFGAAPVGGVKIVLGVDGESTDDKHKGDLG